MNSKMKSLALMTAMLAMSQPIPIIEGEYTEKKDTSYLRRKCKSCKQFHKNYCSLKPYRRQQDTACERYEHR